MKYNPSLDWCYHATGMLSVPLEIDSKSVNIWLEGLRNSYKNYLRNSVKLEIEVDEDSAMVIANGVAAHRDSLTIVAWVRDYTNKTNGIVDEQITAAVWIRPFANR